MRDGIARRIIGPMAVLILATAFVGAWSLSWALARHWEAEARRDMATAETSLLDTLALTHDPMVARLTGEMSLLQSEARRCGTGSRGPSARAGGQEAPGLRFGRVSQSGLMARLEPIAGRTEDLLSIFSLRGGDLVCLASAGAAPGRSKAVGSVLDPDQPAWGALDKGRAYWGTTVRDGELEYSYDEPIRDAAGTMIGAFVIETPLTGLSPIYLAIHRDTAMDQGFLALLDPGGRPLYSGSGLPAAADQALLREGKLAGGHWIVHRRPFPPWGLTVLAAFPLKDLQRTVWAIRLGTMAAALLLVAALTLSHYLVLRRNLLRPLGDLLDILGMISTYKQYELRFKDRHGGEIGILAEALNGLLEQIQAREAQVLVYQEHLEELVARRLDQLQQAKQLLSATLDALPASIAILDGEGRVLVTNRTWGQPAQPFLQGAGPGADYLALCRGLGESELRGAAGQIITVILGTQPSALLDYDLDLDGRHHWYTAVAARFLAQDTPHIVLAHWDVTEQRLLEGQLRQAQKLESIGQLASGIAHEINTPTQYIGDNTIFLQGAFQDLLALVVALQGPADAARQALAEADLGFLETEIPRALEQSLEGIRRVSGIVSAMKDFSHPGGSSKTPTDLNRAIESTTVVCRTEWKYVADLELDLDPGLPPVPCLSDEFNQVILNLVINAAHAITEARPGGKGMIRITTRAAAGLARIQVEDDGAGIPEAIRSRIFDPFFTTKAVGKGTGQGLAIAYAVIVEHHGGTIQVESEAGKGATFTLQLPFESRPHAEVP